MRIQPSVHLQATRTIRLSAQVSLLALLAGLSAGCSGIFPIREPLFTGSTANQQEIISSQASASQPSQSGAQTAPAGYGVYADAQSGAVQRADLPPPAAAPATVYTPPPVAQTPQPYAPPQQSVALAPVPQPAPAAERGAPPTTLGEQATRIDGGGTGGAIVHTVAPGDTAWNISRRYGISVDQLAAANGGTINVKLGTKIAINGATRQPADQAPVQLASADPHSVPTPTLANLAPAATAATAPPAAPATPLAAAVPAAAASEPAPQQMAAIAPQATPPAAETAATPPPAAAAGFRWPVKGRVISGFGKKPNGERNDGINLAVPEGTAVKAAEDGTVIYSGNELKSYGNLVLVRHSDGWVSAYAHNGELKVKRGESVRRGQIIATSGMTGGVTTPQVHFELRKDATPVDPLQHMTEG